jgi:hypothetical protein
MSTSDGLSSGTRHDYNELYSPGFTDLKVGDRLRYTSIYGIPFGDNIITTCGTSYYCSTAGSTAVYVPNHGIVRATATGYYTIQKPDVPGLELTLFTYGTTDQYFRVSSAGTGTTVMTFACGTGTTFVVVSNSSHANCSLKLKALSTSLWLLESASGSIASGTFAAATSS